jgi:hypothetical protein
MRLFYILDWPAEELVQAWPSMRQKIPSVRKHAEIAFNTEESSNFGAGKPLFLGPRNDGTDRSAYETWLQNQNVSEESEGSHGDGESKRLRAPMSYSMHLTNYFHLFEMMMARYYKIIVRYEVSLQNLNYFRTPLGCECTPHARWTPGALPSSCCPSTSPSGPSGTAPRGASTACTSSAAATTTGILQKDSPGTLFVNTQNLTGMIFCS